MIEHILAGELDSAADIIASAGNPTIEANHPQTRLASGCWPPGERPHAEAELERALAFYRSVDASFYVAQIESALAGAQSESA